MTGQNGLSWYTKLVESCFFYFMSYTFRSYSIIFSQKILVNNSVNCRQHSTCYIPLLSSLHNRTCLKCKCTHLYGSCNHLSFSLCGFSFMHSFIYTNIRTKIVYNYKLFININFPTFFSYKSPSSGRRHYKGTFSLMALQSSTNIGLTSLHKNYRCQCRENTTVKCALLTNINCLPNPI